MISGDMIDREFINIYTLEVSEEDVSSIQHDTEVENLLKINLKDFYNFCINNAENCKGYTVISDEEITFTKMIFYHIAMHTLCVLVHCYTIKSK